ncbi:hypothetical protein AB0L85_26330 [Streptomyces sp. NPDC052051]|uniref:hypothetical protein n=1 Tax=Streptomyces sp. NPDC052051 TaxID=3154649 RepID=UPI003443799F
MTEEFPTTRRRRAPQLPLPATGAIGGGATVSVLAYVGAPWGVVLCSVLCTAMASVAAALLPQESKDRSAVVQGYFRHRERMYRLRREPSRQRAEGRTE